MSEQIAYIRNNSVAISYESRTGLNYVSQATGLNNPDALADTVIMAWLIDKHPEVVEHIRRRQEADNAFRDKLRKQHDPFAEKPVRDNHP